MLTFAASPAVGIELIELYSGKVPSGSMKEQPNLQVYFTEYVSEWLDLCQGSLISLGSHCVWCEVGLRFFLSLGPCSSVSTLRVWGRGVGGQS